jgi:hypothetical protein
MSFTKEHLKEAIKMYFTERPNTSPLIVINKFNTISPQLGAIAAAQICIMREADGVLIATGQDENGVLLSYIEEQ